jgi:hypothetical protein
MDVSTTKMSRYICISEEYYGSEGVTEDKPYKFVVAFLKHGSICYVSAWGVLPQRTDF